MTVRLHNPTTETLELLGLGSLQGACHPLWSQMLSHEVVKARKHVSIHPSLYPCPIFLYFVSHIYIFSPFVVGKAVFYFPFLF
jgi:hypothetical protein